MKASKVKKWIMACGATSTLVGVNAYSESTSTASDKVCLALRGNGPRIFAHFGGIAKVVEEIGEPIAAAGGSSASITSFLMESMQMNPTLSENHAERRKQLSLMLKTVEGLLHMVGESKQVAAAIYLMDKIERIRTGVNEATLDPEEAIEHVKSLLNKELLGLVNPELLAFLANPKTPAAWRLAEVKELIGTFGTFSSSNPKILVRPGLVNFDKFSELMGRIGSFYASYSPMKNSTWTSFFASCSETEGELWPDFTPECRQQFKKMASDFFSAEPGKNRQDDLISGQSHFHTLITTSVTSKARAIKRINTLKSRYFNSNFMETDIDFKFKDFSFGYWGKQAHLEGIMAQAQVEDNLQWEKSFSLGQRKWKEALSLSPAEPGLTNALSFRNGSFVSFGGWSNLFPVEVLKVIPECKKVVFLTRPGLGSRFARGVAKQIGASDSQVDALFDLTSPDSGISRAIQKADYRLCSDWDSVPLNVDLQGFSALVKEGYRAPLYSQIETGPEAGCHP